MKSPQTQTKQRLPAAKSHQEGTAGTWSLVLYLHSLPIYSLSSSVITAIPPLRLSITQTAPACPEICMEAKDQNALSSKEL